MRPARRPIRLFSAAIMVGLLSLAAPAIAQQDVVITTRKDSDETIKRKGAIVEWKGMSLSLNSNGREREIDNDEIVDVQTSWDSDYLAGLAELKRGRTQIAIVNWEEALKNETRPWAQRIIRAKLVDAFMEIEKPAAAVDQFFRILADDPNSRFLPLIPLAWVESGNALAGSAEQWIESREPVVQLIGASWLVNGPQRDSAIKTLQELASDIDPNIQGLAAAQLWRVRVGVNAKQADVWQDIVGNMPRAIRAGPYLVLADAQLRAGQVEKATINWMRLPILYPEQRSLAAAALYRVAGLLHNQGDTKQAQSTLHELTTSYPQTIWAQQASQ